MKPDLRPLDRQTVVITGASSGIGLATARMAAAAGARVVIASRNGSALEAIARELDPTGRRVLVVEADVGRREDVERLARAAVARFGGFDTWVNNAGVAIWGRLADVAEADHRRLFETNFWGTVHGSLAAAEQMRGRGGAIVNVGSIVGDRAWPLQGMYSASKHAIKGFTDALRMELEEEGAGISVTLVKPASIGTPLVQHALNRTGRHLGLPPPVYAPEEVAHAICQAAQHPVRDIHVGGAGAVASALGQHAPRAADRVSELALFSTHLSPVAAPPSEGNLHRPGPAGQVRGEDFGPMQSSYYTRVLLQPAVLHPLRGLAELASTALSPLLRPPR